MSTSALSSSHQTQLDGGLRHINLRQDLGEMAELIEICFGPTMDSGGRAAIREMKALSRSGPFLWLLMHIEPSIRALTHGFVWVNPQDEELIGNVSVYPSEHDKKTWVIANVAVHPDYRRQGLAQRMMKKAMDYAVRQGASAVILQVEAKNTGARRLYEQLNFRTMRGFIHWRRQPSAELPAPLPNLEKITYRRGSEWRAEYELAQQVRPNERGGLGWGRDTVPGEFRRTFWTWVRQLFSAKQVTRWVLRDEQDTQLLATMRTELGFGSSYAQLDLLVHPNYQGTLEAPMLNFIIRHLAMQQRGIIIHHPDDNPDVNLLFRQYRFEKRRHLIHMSWTSNDE